MKPPCDLTVSGDPHADNNNIKKIGMLFDIWEDIGNPVLILGDLFDTKEIIRGIIFNYVRDRLKQSKLNFFIMVGNHDWFNLDCLDHSLRSFGDLPNVTIVDKPTMLCGKLLLMPYYNDIGKFRAALQDPAFKDAEVLFMHQGVIGFDYGNGHVADGSGHGEMDFATTVRFKKVISGHFHKFAQQGNLTFLGTPFTQDFGETDQVKYLGVFHGDDYELELTETPFQRHITLAMDCSLKDPLLGLKKRLESSEDYFRVRLIGTEMQIAAVNKAEFPAVKFLDEPTDADQIENPNIKDTDSNDQKFLVWAKEIKNLDEATISEGLEILQKVC